MASFTTGRPLDAEAAAARARQIAALADPIRLRLLSVIVTSVDAAMNEVDIAQTLAVSVEDAAEHLRLLEQVGLVTVQPGDTTPKYVPSPDAWIRFGRMLALPLGSDTPAGAPVNRPKSELPSAIEKIAERLAYRFSSVFSPETVHKYVAESYQLLSERATVTKHLASLTSRFATDRLGALATAQGYALTGTPEILFVCVQNAGRSQIAAGIVRQLAGDRVHVRTAGSQPASSLDDQAIEVLDEIGVPVVAEFPKPLTDEVVQASDIVVTMGCGDACPVYPGRRYMDWPVEDPMGLPIERVREIRDDIHRRVVVLLQSLGIEAAVV